MLKDKLKERREKLGYTQDMLAQKTGLTQQAIAGYETGVRKPNTDILAALADVLECSTDYLLGRSEQ